MSYFDHIFKGGNKNYRNLNEVNINDTVVNIDIEDPNEIIADYFNIIKTAQDEDEVLDVLINLFYEGIEYGIVTELVDDIKTKIEMLQSIKYGLDTE